MHELFKHTNEGQRNWIKALFDHATIGILVTNRNGLIINFNKQAERDFGYTKEEVIHQPLEILLLPAMKIKGKAIMRHGRDLYAQRKDGSFKAEKMIDINGGSIIILNESKLKNLPY